MKVEDILNRKGIIKIPFPIFKQLTIMEIKDLFLNFFPIHAEHNFATQNITYYGISPLFNKVEDYVEPPEYTVVFKNKTFLKFEKQE